MGSHYWVRAPRRHERERMTAQLSLPPVLATVDAHRLRRGPYTAAGSLLRAIGRDALRRDPELGVRYHIEILTAAPEFEDAVTPIAATLEQVGEDGTRTRYQARLHTLRIAHGLVELVRDYLAVLGSGPRTLVVENLHEADPSDGEFISVLLRRLPPSQLTLVVGTDQGPLVESPGPVSISLPTTLLAMTTPVDPATSGPTGRDRSGGDEGGPTGDPDGLARAYVDSDATSDDPAHRAAYDRLSPAARAELHDERANTLAAQGERSLWFGAIPFHLEHGSDPSGRGAAALREAQLRCKSLGLYHSAVDLGMRGRAVVDRSSQPELWWDLTGDVTTSLSAVGRAEEAEALYEQAREITSDPLIHMHAAYGTAMLYARHFGDERRDPRRARRWLNLAVALSSQLPDRKQRAFFTVFNRNGIALVETREGRMDEALRLLNEGMTHLDRELPADDELLHRTGLRYNRAQIHGMMGRLEQALADYSAVIAVDPNFHDHYFNRGNILRRLGRMEEAIADYERSLRLSPPFPEAYYNRADARLEVGDVQGALADFGRVLELDPDHVDARLNRASLLCDLDQSEAAWADLTAGLMLSPDNAHLLCLKGRLMVERGDADGARRALSAALRTDDGMAEAWALLGGLAYDATDHAAAISHLSRAIELAGTAEMRFNRAVSYEAAGQLAEAIADYDAVLAMGDDSDALARRQFCLRAAA